MNGSNCAPGNDGCAQAGRPEGVFALRPFPKGTALMVDKPRVTRPDESPGEDMDVVRRILSGDVNAFETLVRRNRQDVSRIVSRRAPRDQADELVAEVFARAYVSLGNYRGESPFSHWLAIIAARACHDFWRGRYRNRETPMSVLSEEGRAFVDRIASDDDVASPEELFRKKEAAELLDYALSGLSATDRMVVILAHLEEKSVAETAELLGISRANVKIRAFRARGKLRRALAAALGGE